MYRSRKSFIIFQFFSWYIAYIIKKDFSAFAFNKLNIKESEAVLLLANHFSWWDGFLMFQLNRILFRKQFHVLVTAADFKNKWFLKYLGAFAAESKGKNAVEALLYAGELLNDPKNLVLIFPQGRLYSGHVTNIAFEKGIMQIINASKKKFQIVFAASLTDYFENRKPGINTCLAHWNAEEYVSLQLLKSEYNKHYENAIRIQSHSV